jgi:hypothetical protein
MSRSSKDEPVYMAVESFIHPGGYVAAGTKLRQIVGPAQYWIPEGDDADVATAKLRLGDDVLEAGSNRDKAAKATEEKASQPDRRVRAIRSFQDWPNIDVIKG